MAFAEPIERTEHDRSAAVLAPDQFGNGVDLVG